jgi:hypothetical protein
MGVKMKIILSRKGFDSKYGGIPSPIMPCGKLLSLPIPVPDRETGIPYDNLNFDGRPFSEIIEQLNNGPFQHPQAHLDPDLERDRYARKSGWRPVFGQQGKAQDDLKNVKKNDLFLFFGYFQHTKYENNKLQYIQQGRELHVFFGWLQIERIIVVERDRPQNEFPIWLQYHPHIVNRYPHNNTIFVATQHLTFNGIKLGVRGAGTFPCFKTSLQLTAPKEKARSHWSLPTIFFREQNSGNWACHKRHCPFDSHKSGRIQEFVFEINDGCQDVKHWLKSLFEDC